ncbi:two-component regulator propeller domain-containing protein [Nostoc sp. NIES-2111]
MRALWMTGCLLLTLGMARGQQLRFTHTALPQEKPAKAICQDRDGFLWVGSEGLYRYDGVQFTPYLHDAKDSTSLVADNVYSVCEGKGSWLWVGTQWGISRVDRVTGKITNYSEQIRGRRHLLAGENYVWADTLGAVWAGSYRGLLRYDARTDAFVRYPLALPGGVRRIVPDHRHKGLLWLTYRDGVARLNPATGDLKPYPLPRGVDIYNLLPDSRGHIWLCSWGAGLGLLDTATGKARFYRYEDTPDSNTHNIVFDLVEQRRGDACTYYASTAQGLTMPACDADGVWRGRFSPFFRHDPADPSSVGLDLGGLFIDRQNTLWMAEATGLGSLPPDNRCFQTYSQAGLGYISSLTPRQQGGWWMGGWYSQDVNVVEKGSLESRPTGYLLPTLSPDAHQVSGLVEDTARHRLWIGTFGGLFSVNLATGRRTSWPGRKDAYPALGTDRITGMIQAGERLWIGTYTDGVALLNLRTDRYEPLPPGLREALAGRRIFSLYADGQGVVWLGVNWDLFRIEPGGRWQLYRHEAGKPRSKAEGDVLSFAEDASGTLWIGSQGGLNRYCPQTDDFDLFTTAQGLADNEVGSLLADRRGTLWIGTRHGLNAMDIATGTVRRYDRQNGLPSNGDFNSLALCPDDGCILIGGTGMVTRFHPDRLRIASEPPPVRITGLRLINHPERAFYPDKIGPEGITLRYDENYLALDFVALSFIRPDQNRYRYRLEGLDEAWSAPTSDRRVTYGALPPGRYVFRVKGADAEGLWNETGASLVITVLPPFWKTGWFISLAVLAVGLLLYGIYRYRLAQVLKLERIRADISAGLHDDIGSTLSSISILSGIRTPGADAQVTGTLAAINESSRGLMEQMNDIVWSINPRHDSLQSLLTRLRSFAGRVLEARDIDYTFRIEPQVPNLTLNARTRQNLYLILKEGVNNAAKHSAAARVDLHVWTEGGLLHLDLHDDGRGYDPAVPTEQNGLANMAARAAAIGAQIRVETSPGAGTRIALTVRSDRYAIARLWRGR